MSKSFSFEIGNTTVTVLGYDPQHDITSISLKKTVIRETCGLTLDLCLYATLVGNVVVVESGNASARDWDFFFHARVDDRARWVASSEFMDEIEAAKIYIFFGHRVCAQPLGEGLIR
jgi:hypothetical protein